MAKRRTDWSRLGVEPLPETGKARRFRDTSTGETLSRRQVENRRVALGGHWESWSEWQDTTSPRSQTRRAKDYRFWANRAHEERGASFATLRKPGDDFAQAYADYMHQSAAERRHDKTLKRGHFHHMLVAAGMRDPQADYPPGQTPLRKAKR